MRRVAVVVASLAILVGAGCTSKEDRARQQTEELSKALQHNLNCELGRSDEDC